MAGPTTRDHRGPDPVPAGSLRQVALGGGRLGAIAAVVSQALSVVTTVVLVRLLTPLDIGLVAAATVVIGLFEILAEVGLRARVVQRPSVDQSFLSTTFWSTMALGLGVAILGSATAPISASLIGNPAVAPFVVAVSLVSFVTFANAVPKAILQRELRFGPMYAASIGPLIAYAVTAIAVAGLTDLGPWSIIVARIVQVVMECIGLAVATRWRPSFQFDMNVVKSDLRFNTGFWANTVASYASKNADYWTVGRTIGSASLGLYYVAFVLPNIVRQRMTWVAQDVLFPLLARLGDDDDRLANGYLRTIRLVAFIAYPVLIGIAALSSRIIGVFFGPLWTGAVAPMEFLAVAAAIDALTPVTSVVFVSRGEPGRSLAVNLLRLAVLITGLVAAAVIGGLTAVAVAVLASSVAAAVFSQLQMGKRIGIGLVRVARAVSPMALASLVMAMAVRIADLALGGRHSSAVALGGLVMVGGLAYLVCGLILDRRLILSLVRDVTAMAVPRRRRLAGAHPAPEGEE